MILRNYLAKTETLRSNMEIEALYGNAEFYALLLAIDIDSQFLEVIEGTMRRRGHKVKGQQFELLEWNYVMRAKQHLDIDLCTLMTIADRMDKAGVTVPMDPGSFAMGDRVGWGDWPGVSDSNLRQPLSKNVRLAADGLRRFIGEPFIYVCIIRDGDTYYRGISIRNKKDVFKPGLGYNIAKGRAYRAWYHRRSDDVVRKKGELEVIHLCEAPEWTYKSEINPALSEEERKLVDGDRDAES